MKDYSPKEVIKAAHRIGILRLMAWFLAIMLPIAFGVSLMTQFVDSLPIRFVIAICAFAFGQWLFIRRFLYLASP